MFVDRVEAAEGRSPACVLAGIDFSPGAISAVREARSLATRLRLDLQVLHVTSPGRGWRPDATSADWLREAAVDPARLLVRQGLTWVEIVRHAREVGAGFIVLGSHGASGSQPMTLGSTATRVALRAPCPVLFVTGDPEGQLTSPSQSHHTIMKESG